MSKSTKKVVYFDWKTVIYIYVCGKCRTQFMLPMEKSITFTGARANEIIPSINRSFVYKAKEGEKKHKKQQKIPSPFYFMYGRFVHFQLSVEYCSPTMCQYMHREYLPELAHWQYAYKPARYGNIICDHLITKQIRILT